MMTLLELITVGVLGAAGFTLEYQRKQWGTLTCGLMLIGVSFLGGLAHQPGFVLWSAVLIALALAFYSDGHYDYRNRPYPKSWEISFRTKEEADRAKQDDSKEQFDWVPLWKVATIWKITRARRTNSRPNAKGLPKHRGK